MRLAHQLTSIPPDTTVSTSALSWTARGTGRDAVLLIHGFTGIVGEMEFLGRQLSEAGLTVSIPRLPGHGTNHQDFLSVRWQDWYRRCLDEYLELASKYYRVHVAGLSMGGLLALLIAAQFRPARIALAAPALVSSIPSIRLAPIAKYFVRSVARKTETQHDEPDAELRHLAAEYRGRYWVGPVAELRSLQRFAASILPSVQSDTLTIVSKGDRTVPVRVVDLIEKRIGSEAKRRVVLEESSHVVVDDVERELVAEEVVRWFTR